MCSWNYNLHSLSSVFVRHNFFLIPATVLPHVVLPAVCPAALIHPSSILHRSAHRPAFPHHPVLSLSLCLHFSWKRKGKKIEFRLISSTTIICDWCPVHSPILLIHNFDCGSLLGVSFLTVQQAAVISLTGNKILIPKNTLPSPLAPPTHSFVCVSIFFVRSCHLVI